MAAQAQFSTTDVTVQPGESQTLSLTLVNLGSRTETFTLIPSGLVAGWVRLSPPTVSLFGGTHAEIEVTLRPPALATTPAGPAPLTVRIIPQNEPDEVVIAETTVIIGAFHDRRVHLLQPVVRSRRRATYEFLVENQGNSQASCRLHLVDTSHRLDGDFDPPAVGIEPGGTSLVRLRMKAVRRQWSRGSRTLPFVIEADQQGFPTASASANFVQTPILPQKVGRRLFVLLLLAGALAGAWFGLVKPATRRAAKDAVRDYTPVVVTTQPPLAGAITPVTASTVPQEAVPTTTAAPAPGRPFSITLQATATPQNPGGTVYEVPGGQDLHVTDMILQNANNDTGLATVSKNDTFVTRWNLAGGSLNHDPLQVFTPIVFEGGTKLNLSLRCDGVGPDAKDDDAGHCADSLLVSGLLFPAGS
ncbi:MAG: hypothetical protein JWN62_53 [Acidimicrobiales bacterium]|nr:hypothetical protein [Acidimicrobiales bacterium]